MRNWSNNFNKIDDNVEINLQVRCLSYKLHLTNI